MTEPLTSCFHYILPFQKVERFEGAVPWNVPPFQVERKVQVFAINLLICNNKKWNVPDYFLGTRAYRSTQHSLLESVWKLDGPLGNKVFVTPLTKLCWLDNECDSASPTTGSYGKDPRTGNSVPQVFLATEFYEQLGWYVSYFSSVRKKNVVMFTVI